MAGNRSVAIEQLNKESLRILNVNLPTSCLLSVFGLIAFVGNTLVVIVVAKNKGLHHRCSLLVVNLAIADILVGLSFVAIGAKRWILVSYNLPETNSTFNCLSQLWVPLMAQTASQNLASAICIDRISAVCRPKSYPHSPIGYTVGLAASAWLYAILLGSLAFLGVHDTELTTNCIMGTNVSDIFTQFTDFQDIVMTSLITIAYTLLIFKLNCKKTVEPKGVTNEVKKVNEIKVTMTLATNAFVYFLTHVLYSIGMHVVKNFDSQTAELAIPWIRNLPIIDSGINVFIYVWRSSEFRVAFLNLFKNSPFLHLNLVHNSSSLNKI